MNFFDRVRNLSKKPFFWGSALLVLGFTVFAVQGNFSLRGDILDAAAKPPAPTNFKATINGQDANGMTVNTVTPTIQFSWTPVSDSSVTQYHIVLHDPAGMWPDGWTPAADKTTIIVVPQGLNSGVQYGYSIRSRNSAGVWSDFVTGGQFETLSITLPEPDITPPTPPTNFKGTLNGQDLNNQTVTTLTPVINFTWGPSSDEQSGVKQYHIRVTNQTQSVVIDRWYIPAPAGSFNAMFEGSALRNGDTYTYAIHAQNNANPNGDEGDLWSEWVHGGQFTVNTTQTCVPKPRTDLVVQAFVANALSDTAQAVIKNISPLCSYNVALSSYELTVGDQPGPQDDGAFFAGQRHFRIKTAVIAPGTTADLNIAIPANCQWQVDVFEYHDSPPLGLPDPVLLPPNFAANSNRFTLFDWRQNFQDQLCGQAPVVPSCTISANPQSLNPGETSTLSWTTTNAISASINQNIGSVAIGSGQKMVTPSATTTYRMTVMGTGNTQASCEVVVGVAPTPLNFRVVKTATPLEPNDQQDITYTITVSNTGTTAQSVFLTDTLGPGTSGGTLGPISGETAVSWSNGTGTSTGTLASGRITFTNFPAGATATVTYKRKANFAGLTAASSFTNTAKLFSCTP